MLRVGSELRDFLLGAGQICRSYICSCPKSRSKDIGFDVQTVDLVKRRSMSLIMASLMNAATVPA